MPTDEGENTTPANEWRRGRVVTRFLVVLVLFLVAVDCVSVVLWARCTGSNWTCAVEAGIFEVTWGPSDKIIYYKGPQVNLAPPYWEGWHFEFGKDSSAGTRTIAFPLWVLAVCAAIASVAANYFTVRNPQKCPSCRYDLSGLRTTVCPECGENTQHLTNSRSPVRPITSFYKENKNAVRTVIITIAIGAGLVGAFRAWLWSMTRFVTVTIPTGYVGDILFVEDPNGVEPERHWRSFAYVVPESGVLRVTRTDVLASYARLNFISCRQTNGQVIPDPRERKNGEPWFTYDGPWGQKRICVLTVGIGENRPRAQRVPHDLLEKFRKDGVPADYVAPHEIR